MRAPNHLGDVVMALPALAADASDVVVLRWLAPLVVMADLPGRVIPFDRGYHGWREAVSGIRAAGYDEGVLLTPSFSAAWLFRWAGLRSLRGTDTDARGLLLTDRIPRQRLAGRHRINQYKLLLGQDPDGAAENHPLSPPPERVDEWSRRLGGDGRGAGTPVVGLFPGSNAPARRWPARRFASTGRALGEAGARVVVMGGPSERERTGFVSRGIPRAIDAGGETDLPDLAALLSLCSLVVTNDTGPMHLAGAVGTPTLTLWGPSDPQEVCPVGARDIRIDGGPLPCRPCFKNACPRRGAGTWLPEAHEECMQMIPVEKVVEAIKGILA